MPDTILSILHVLTDFTPITMSESSVTGPPSFIDEASEVQRDEVIGLKLHM